MPLSAEDFSLFHDSVAAYLRERYDDSERRRIVDSDAGWSKEHWEAFANELGLLGAAFPEEWGGLGGGAAAHGMIMELFGSALVAEPYLSTVVIGGGFLQYGSMPGTADIVGQLIEGGVRIALAHGEPATRYNLAHVETSARKDGDSYVIDGNKAVVLGAAAATHFVIIARSAGGPRDAAGLCAFLVDAGTPGIERRDFRTISGGIASELTLSGVRAPMDRLLTADGEALPLIERVIDEATAILCREAIGVMRRLHGDTLEYTQQRNQFGKALASFQALQHRMVDMLMMLTHATSLAERATEALAASDAERARMVSAAKVYIGKSARFCGQNAIQLHGGMGMTDELAVGFFFKRAIEIERQFGNIDHHLTRYERLSFAPGMAA